MQVYNTSTLLADLSKQTSGILNDVENVWSKLPVEALHHSPGAGKWNALQCIEHLNSYGRYYLPEIEKAISGKPAGSTTLPTEFTPGWLGDYFTRSMQPKDNGKLKKMQAPKGHRPGLNLDTEAVLNEFREQQTQMLKLLALAKNIDLNSVKVPISIARFIKLKLGDVFMFILAHNLRHITQGQKAIAGFSGTRQMRRA